MHDAIYVVLSIMGYSAVGGISAFVGYQSGKEAGACQPESYAVIGSIAWPVALPGMLTYWLCYFNTSDYQQNKLEETERQLDQLGEELEEIAEFDRQFKRLDEEEKEANSDSEKTHQKQDVEQLDPESLMELFDILKEKKKRLNESPGVDKKGRLNMKPKDDKRGSFEEIKAKYKEHDD